MNYIERKITNKFFHLKKHFPVIILTGARQVIVILK